MKRILLLSYFMLTCAFFSVAQSINISVIKNVPSCWNTCCGEIEIVTSGTHPPFSYQWSTGENGTGIYNIVSGNYTVTVTDNNGFTASETIEVADLAVEHEVYEWQSQSCFGEMDVVLKDSVLSGLPPFTYSIFDEDDNFVLFSGPVQDSIFFYENLAGGATYRIKISDDRVCFSEVNFTTAEKLEFQIEAGEDIQLPTGESFQLNAQFSQVPSSITWTPTDFLSCADCSSPIISPTENICYTIEATNADGCIARDTLCVEVGTTALEKINQEDFEVTIFPNPVQDNILLGNNILGKWKYRLIDIYGNVLLWKNEIHSASAVIDVHQMAKGIYFLEINAERGSQKQVFKIVKN